MNEKLNQQEENTILFLLALVVMVLTYLYQFGWLEVGLGILGSLLFVLLIAGALINADCAREREAQRRQRDKRIICPHCQTKGQVTTAAVTVNVGISGGKATAAILTGGVSMLATGLSNRQAMTKATCSNCGSVWHF